MSAAVTNRLNETPSPLWASSNPDSPSGTGTVNAGSRVVRGRMPRMHDAINSA